MYSTVNAQKRALEERIRKSKIQAKAQHPDYKARFPDEARDAGKSNPSFTLMIARIKKEFDHNLEKLKQRREKLGERI